MLDSIECPYCGAEYIDPDIAEDGEGVYTVECERCGREFDVGACLELRLDVIVPEELKDCFKRCRAWDITGHCDYGKAFKLCEGHVTCTVPDCPLGHPMDRD